VLWPPFEDEVELDELVELDEEVDELTLPEVEDELEVEVEDDTLPEVDEEVDEETLPEDEVDE
jgi:hypothetical protein